MSAELRPNLVALQTIVQREIRRYTRIWPQTLPAPGDHHGAVLRHLRQPDRRADR